MSLMQKLEGDSMLVRQCEAEIRALHTIFVTWFRGEQELTQLQNDLKDRMVPTFSHVAPNGHMVVGRDTLIQYLTDKYGCYEDRTFSIQVYNVQLLWSSKKQCLCSYEEWQSWDDEDEQNGKQQFGRLSTCLLEKKKNSESLCWIHVHETWMEAEEPVIKTPSQLLMTQQNKDDETVMTGPVPPEDLTKRFTTSPGGAAGAKANVLNSVLKPAPDDDDSDDDEESATEASATVATNALASRKVLLLVDYKSAGITKQTDAQEMLQSEEIEFDVVDGAVQWTRCRELQAVSKVTNAYPQFFIVSDQNGQETIHYWGGWPEFKACKVQGTLARDLDLDKAPVISKADQDLKKVTKKVSIVSLKQEDPITSEERQFLEASQGILFFEDEEEGPPPPSADKKKKAAAAAGGMMLDELMELDDHEQDASERSGFASIGSGKSNKSDKSNNSSQAMISLNSAADASHKRHVSPKLENYAKGLTWEGALVGVSIAGFDIGTSQGPIADSDWYATLEAQLEATAQPSVLLASAKRKIGLPEMVFPVAHVAMEGHGIWLSWDAADSLAAWADAHAQIAVNSSESAAGVAVLKTKDAALWQDKRRKQQGAGTDKSAVFHYDWTFSTPFSVKTDGGTWIELDESGIRMDLLTDQSVPILFFDEIVLYEDDLHDNGQVQLSIKLRIMPTCAYILSRLWVRVDNVIVRVRETRVLVDFFGIKAQIYRDVTWRECAWGNLEHHGLPSAVKAWSTEQGGETPEWHNLVQSLPEVALPDGEIQHAVLEYGSGASGSGGGDKMEL